MMAVLLGFTPLASANDRIIMKDGQELSGRIVEESDTEIRLEVRTGTIRELKILDKADVEQVLRPRPDAVAIENVRELIPTPSLLPEEAYRDRIRTGPQKFLLDFPDSQYRAEAEEILDALTKELVRVRRGSIKLDGEWISPEERKVHEKNIEARILLLNIQRQARGGAYLDALRNLDRLAEDYRLSLAYADAVPLAEEILKAYGRQLARQLQDQKIFEEQQEDRLAFLTAREKAEYEAALKQEKDRIERTIEREQRAGVRWLSVDRNDEASLTTAINLVKSELESVQKIDVAALETKADRLYAAESLIFEGELDRAQATLLSLASTEGQNPMVSAAAETLREAKAKRAQELGLEGRDQTQAARISRELTSGREQAGESVEEAGEEGELSAEQKLAMLASQRSGSGSSPSGSLPAKPKPKPERTASKPAPSKPKPAAAPVDEGLPLFQIIMPIGAVVLIGATVLVYLQEKKKKEQGG